jgi:hypothetical protein
MLVVLDFDDTLYPTTVLGTTPPPVAFRIRMAQLDELWTQLMDMAPFCILTAASSDWVRQVCQQVLPRLHAYLDTTVPILSTADTQTHHLYAMGKYALLKAYLTSRPVTRLLSIGDGLPEMYAMNTLRREYPRIVMTHIRCRGRLPLASFLAQLTGLVQRCKAWLRREINPVQYK